MLAGALKPSGAETDFSDHHVPKAAPERGPRGFFVIPFGGVMSVNPVERRQHLSIASRDTRCPDEGFEVIDPKLGLCVCTEKQLGRVRPGIASVGIPRGLKCLQQLLGHLIEYRIGTRYLHRF